MSGNSHTRLVSFLTANSHPEQYGKMESFTMPQGQTVPGRSRSRNATDRRPAISTLITLLNHRVPRSCRGAWGSSRWASRSCCPAVLRGRGRGDGGYPLSQLVVVFTQDYGEFCGPNVQDV